MKRFATKNTILAAIIVMMAVGCRDEPAVLLNGLEGAAAPVKDDTIVGDWKVIPKPPAEGEEPRPERRPTTIHVAEEGEGYTIAIRRGRREQVLNAVIYTVGERRYVDAHVTDTRRGDLTGGYDPPHHIFRFDPRDEGGFYVSFLDQAWILAEHDAGRLPVAHTVAGGIPVITADSAGLAKFLVDYADAGPARDLAWAMIGSHIEPAGTSGN